MKFQKGKLHTNFKHGHRWKEGKTPIYSSWCSMKSRCFYPKTNGYARYGGRGIKVCDRWLGVNGFINFLKDMGDRPIGMTLGRKNNDGDYMPRNCRWETKEQQYKNKVNLAGEACHLSKLKKIEVLKIRKLFDSGYRTRVQLAKMFSVHRDNIGFIIRRKTWKHI